ncbi:MAG TPA: hypothetical protein VF765_25850, partial [Polyangiaceae bacterium]
MRRTWVWGLVLISGSVPLVTSEARAQAQQPAPPAPPPAPQPIQPPTTTAAPGAAEDTTPTPVPADLLKMEPGGLTADQAGARAAQTSWSAKASMESLRSAAAKVDGAWVTFLPRLQFLGKYTRLSNFNPPALGLGSGSL